MAGHPLGVAGSNFDQRGHAPLYPARLWRASGAPNLQTVTRLTPFQKVMIMIELGADALSILRAVFGMGLLTLLMFIWMYATRLPAFSKAQLDPQEAMHPGSYHDRIPSEVRRVADNYNHLFEAPTLFYAIALAIVVAGLADPVHALCAWAYLGLRVAHSLVQATVNKVAVRFGLFALSWVALGIMIVRAMLAITG